MPTNRVFRALDGEEVRKVILRMLDEEMAKDTDFRQHITYPRLEFELTLSVRAFPDDPTRVTNYSGTVIAVDKENKKPLLTPGPSDRPKVLTVRRGHREAPPDAVREKSGLPRTTTRTVPVAGTVDAADDERGRGATVMTRATEGRGARVTPKSDA